jgi:predicted transposase YdaD
MSDPKTPHDALARAIFGTPALMAEELRAALPAPVVAHLDLASLKPIPARFADAQLQGAESDLLFSAQVAGQRALIYVLVEHQSEPDRFMPLRLLRYIGRILDAHRRRHPTEQTLPAVIPIVLCHDLKPWPYPLDLASLFDLPPQARRGLSPFLPDFRFLLDDLAVLDPAELSTRGTSALVTVTLFALKRARHADDLLSELAVIAQQFGELERAVVPDEQLSALLEYIWTTARVDRCQLLSFTKTHAGPKLEAMMKTPAEQCRDEGRAEGEAKGKAEGEAKGKAEGRAEALLKLMQLKFGVVPAQVSAIIGAGSIEQLDRWIERILSANSAAEVITGD